MVSKKPTFDCYLSYDYGYDSKGRSTEARVKKIANYLTVDKSLMITEYNQLMKNPMIPTLAQALNVKMNQQKSILVETSSIFQERIKIGMAESQCVILFITQRYIEKVNDTSLTVNEIKFEFEHCLMTKDRRCIIPVLLDDSYHQGKPSGKNSSIHQLVNSKYHISLNDFEIINDELKALYQYIINTINPIQEIKQTAATVLYEYKDVDRLYHWICQHTTIPTEFALQYSQSMIQNNITSIIKISNCLQSYPNYLTNILHFEPSHADIFQKAFRDYMQDNINVLNQLRIDKKLNEFEKQQKMKLDIIYQESEQIILKSMERNESVMFQIEDKMAYFMREDEKTRNRLDLIQKQFTISQQVIKNEQNLLQNKINQAEFDKDTQSVKQSIENQHNRFKHITAITTTAIQLSSLFQNMVPKLQDYLLQHKSEIIENIVSRPQSRYGNQVHPDDRVHGERRKYINPPTIASPSTSSDLTGMLLEVAFLFHAITLNCVVNENGVNSFQMFQKGLLHSIMKCLPILYGFNYSTKSLLDQNLYEIEHYSFSRSQSNDPSPSLLQSEFKRFDDFIASKSFDDREELPQRLTLTKNDIKKYSGPQSLMNRTFQRFSSIDLPIESSTLPLTTATTESIQILTTVKGPSSPPTEVENPAPMSPLQSDSKFNLEPSYLHILMPNQALIALYHLHQSSLKYDNYHNTTVRRNIETLLISAGMVELLFDMIRFHWEDETIIQLVFDCLSVLFQCPVQQIDDVIHCILLNHQSTLLLLTLLERFESNSSIQINLIYLFSILLRNNVDDELIHSQRMNIMAGRIVHWFHESIHAFDLSNTQSQCVNISRLCQSIINLTYDETIDIQYFQLVPRRHLTGHDNVVSPPLPQPASKFQIKSMIMERIVLMNNCQLLSDVLIGVNRYLKDLDIMREVLMMMINLTYQCNKHKRYFIEQKVHETILTFQKEAIQALYHDEMNPRLEANHSKTNKFLTNSKQMKFISIIYLCNMFISNLIIGSPSMSDPKHHGFPSVSRSPSSSYKKETLPSIPSFNSSPGGLKYINSKALKVLIDYILTKGHSIEQWVDLLEKYGSKSGKIYKSVLLILNQLMGCEPLHLVKERILIMGITYKVQSISRRYPEDRVIYMLTCQFYYLLLQSDAMALHGGDGTVRKKLISNGIWKWVMDGIYCHCVAIGHSTRWSHMHPPYDCQVCRIGFNTLHHIVSSLRLPEGFDEKSDHNVLGGLPRDGLYGLLSVKPPEIMGKHTQLLNMNYGSDVMLNAIRGKVDRPLMTPNRHSIELDLVINVDILPRIPSMGVETRKPNSNSPNHRIKYENILRTSSIGAETRSNHGGDDITEQDYFYINIEYINDIPDQQMDTCMNHLFKIFHIRAL